MSHLSDVHRSTKKRSPYKTVKLTPDHRVPPTGAIYRHSIRRNEPNRPHISSVIQQCQRANTPQSPKPDRYANQAAQQPRQIPRCQPSLRSVPPSLQRVCSTSAPPVRGYLRITPNTRNPPIHKKSKKMRKSWIVKQFQPFKLPNEARHPYNIGTHRPLSK